MNKRMYAISGPVENAALRVVSLGAGVQSTVLLLMAAKREIGPMPDCAIFADTQFEPPAIYEHLAWLSDEVNLSGLVCVSFCVYSNAYRN